MWSTRATSDTRARVRGASAGSVTTSFRLAPLSPPSGRVIVSQCATEAALPPGRTVSASNMSDGVKPRLASRRSHVARREVAVPVTATAVAPRPTRALVRRVGTWASAGPVVNPPGTPAVTLKLPLAPSRSVGLWPANVDVEHFWGVQLPLEAKRPGGVTPCPVWSLVRVAV